MNVFYRLCLTVVLLLALAASAYSQSSLAGRWVWKQAVQQDKSQIHFTVVINRQGNLLRGTYSVDEFINGEWQGEDGNQTPFRGRVTRGGAEVEFDPDATVPGYEQNVRYEAPTDGRKPAQAILSLRGATLHWRTVEGSIERVPAQMTLRRERRPR